MSRTYRHSYHSNLFSNGERSHHNSLTREFKGVNTGGFLVKNCRGLINERDYESDRFKAIRKIMTQRRRTIMKRIVVKMIDEQLED